MSPLDKTLGPPDPLPYHLRKEKLFRRGLGLGRELGVSEGFGVLEGIWGSQRGSGVSEESWESCMGLRGAWGSGRGGGLV